MTQNQDNWTVKDIDDTMLHDVAYAFYRQWGFETAGTENVARTVARWYCAHMMRHVTFGTLFFDGDTLVALSIGGVHGAPRAVPVLPERYNETALYERITQDGGAKTLAFYDAMEQLNGQLYAQAKEKGYGLDAELFFLWVNPEYRGRGLSTMALKAACEKMRAQGAKTFYLFTDTHCDYEFYERQPWTLLGRMPWPRLPSDAEGGTELMYGAKIPD